MAKLPVVEKSERDEIRAQLRTYMDRHQIGAPRLFERMSFTLERIDQSYIDLRSIQRFLRDEVRTDDEKVIRYRRFLAIAAPEIVAPSGTADVPSLADVFADVVKKRTVQPVAVTSVDDPDRQIPFSELTNRKSLADYEGRFVVSERVFGTDLAEDAPAGMHWVLLPEPDGKFLKIFMLAEMRVEGVAAPPPGEELYEPVSADAFMIPFGMDELLVVDVPPLSGGGSFSVLKDVSAAQSSKMMVLEGARLATVAPWSSSAPVSTIRLVRIEHAAETANS
ncbi:MULTISPECIES: hypothetical protein [unclassified Sulfitobacter]|uniref:hypothetical protein n=1 Tax=unclassified Sulfitobacter TaxID=196795 RepID=UPI0007C36902|nr:MULTISPECIES: hypothetical protein [unclassified Sulfitobacter]KZX94255.1 hypothetical protein A3720_04635 [Sulfitobacter sp. HI0021]KZX95382.1 hypothetical protein A3722_18395 [Sulfitobacter sp. HI0027]KZY97979.1 hypothetical protein A3747_01025 [Sulfitobacter sp. HI0076]